MTQVSYQDLEVWKYARSLVRTIYILTKAFPSDEQFGLVSQLRRSAVAVPSNIAEGCGRSGVKDSLRFFFIARGALYEVETQLILANDLGYVSGEELANSAGQVLSCKKLLNGFINYFANRSTGRVNEPFGNYQRDSFDNDDFMSNNKQLSTDN